MLSIGLAAAPTAMAQLEPSDAVVASDDSGQSVLLPGEAWESAPASGQLSLALPTTASDESHSTWDSTSGYDATTCLDSASGCGGRCTNGDCSSGCSGISDPPGFLQFLGHNKNARWTVRSEALLLWRNAPSERPLYSTIDPGTGGLGSTALDANQLNSDVLAAPRLSLLRTDCEGRTLEATYIYAGNFYSDRTLPYSRDGYVTSPPGIYGNSWGPQGTELNTATAKLLGQLQSLEFNARHCLWADTCQFLIGTRWLQWNETLQMQDSFSSPPPPDPVTLEGTDFYQTQCFNNLWGGQIGLDTLLLGRVGQARVEGLVKAGAYYNAAGQTSAYTYQTVPPFAFSGQTRSTGPASASFVGEVGMTAVLPISSNWDFRCGYFGLWLTGLAQPANQLSDQTITQIDAPSGTLDTTGTLILQGLSLGLEGRW
jgi:hypothetical protein